MMKDILIRSMTRPELDRALDWAAREGWNPGLHDADGFWAADPDGFVVAERRDEVVGVTAVASYDGRYGHMGLFIVRPDCRKLGIGRELWQEGMKILRSRLLEGTTTAGLCTAPALRASCEKSGFTFYGHDKRFEGRGERTPPPAGIVPAARVPFASMMAVDSEHFPTPRPRFLAKWLRLPDSAVFVAAPRGTTGKLAGYAVVRKCRAGFKIGPLFAKDEASAESLFSACSTHAAGQPLFMDVPEGNAPALALAARHNMKEVSACARLYQGAVPVMNHAGVYGVTSLELG
jgi:GNAT superfamily N-acetyltransferase